MAEAAVYADCSSMTVTMFSPAPMVDTDISTIDTTAVITPAAAPVPTRERKDSFAEPRYEAPLYTEINIPLPPLPKTPPRPSIQTPTSPITPSSPTSPLSTKSRKSFSPFHRRRQSSPASSIPEYEVPKPQRIEFSMRAASRGQRKRSSTIEAAITPAVMVLAAELFTPGEGSRGKNVDIKDRLEIMK